MLVIQRIPNQWLREGMSLRPLGNLGNKFGLGEIQAVFLEQPKPLPSGKLALPEAIQAMPTNPTAL